MTKQMSSIRFSVLTLDQLSRLVQATGMRQSDVITMAIDRMYWQHFGDPDYELPLAKYEDEEDGAEEDAAHA